MAGYTTLNIPVTLVVTGGAPAPLCTVNLPELSFSGPAGSVTAPQTEAVSDTCGALKSFTASPGASWISVSPSSGTGKFDVTVTVPSVATTGSINVTISGVAYTVMVTATPTGPACTTPTQILLQDSTGMPTSLLNVAGTTSGVVSQAVSVKDDCGRAYTTYSYSYYAVASGAACTPPASASGQPSWMSVAKSPSDASKMNLTFTQTQVGSYKACIDVKPDNGALPTVTLPVLLTVASAPPVGVTQLTSAVTARMETAAPKSGKVYSAMHTASRAAFSLMTRDWANNCDMIVMYSGATCGEKLPDVNDYNAIMASIATTGVRYVDKGKIFADNSGIEHTFYYSVSGLNEGVTTVAGIPQGCYYVYIFNTEAGATATYDVLFTDIP
jgi:hypothetical protein